MQIIIVQYSYGAYVKKAPRNELFCDSLHTALCCLGLCHATAKTNSLYISSEAPAINPEQLRLTWPCTTIQSHAHTALSSSAARKRKWRFLNDAFVLDLLALRWINCLLKYLLFFPW